MWVLFSPCQIEPQICTRIQNIFTPFCCFSCIFISQISQRTRTMFHVSFLLSLWVISHPKIDQLCKKQLANLSAHPFFRQCKLHLFYHRIFRRTSDHVIYGLIIKLPSRVDRVKKRVHPVMLAHWSVSLAHSLAHPRIITQKRESTIRTQTRECTTIS